MRSDVRPPVIGLPRSMPASVMHSAVGIVRRTPLLSSWSYLKFMSAASFDGEYRTPHAVSSGSSVESVIWT